MQQLCERLFAIRKALGKISGQQGTKRSREQDAAFFSPDCASPKQQQEEPAEGYPDLDGLLRSLVNNLETLMRALEESSGSGTPAIHMYSILDQVAALHDEVDCCTLGHLQTTMQQIDEQLVCILKQCKDDGRRQGVRPTRIRSVDYV